jgi:hypothetical protein
MLMPGFSRVTAVIAPVRSFTLLRQAENDPK